MKNARLGLGIAIGVAVGFGIAYFMDKEKRDSFMRDLRSTADRTKDSLLDNYYEAKEKYYSYRNKLKRDVEDFVDDVEDMGEDLVRKED